MKNSIKKYSWFVLVCMFLGMSCSKKNDPPIEQQLFLFTANGDIQPRLEEFRQFIGGSLNTEPGSTGGRREINWDGIPDQLLGQKLPDDFFNPTEPGAPANNQRGLRYSSPGNPQVSKTAFIELNPAAANEFEAFSGNKVFSNVGSNLWDVEFEVPGQARAAGVNGFGIVFADVDQPNSNALEFFNGERSLGKFFVPAQNGQSKFSFLAVYFKNEKITRVRVSHEGKLEDGQPDLSDGGPADLVVMDDFIYSEPVEN